MIEFMGKDSVGDDCIHLHFPNGAILSYSTYNRSVRAWWPDGTDIPMDRNCDVDAYLFTAYAAAISQLKPKGTVN